MINTEMRPCPTTRGKLYQCGYRHRLWATAKYGVPIHAGGMLLCCGHHLPIAVDVQSSAAVTDMRDWCALVYSSPLGYWEIANAAA